MCVKCVLSLRRVDGDDKDDIRDRESDVVIVGANCGCEQKCFAAVE